MPFPRPTDPDYCPGSNTVVEDLDDQREWFRCPSCRRLLKPSRRGAFFPHVGNRTRTRASDQAREILDAHGHNEDPRRRPMPDGRGGPTVVEFVDQLLLLRQNTPVYLDDEAFSSSDASGDYVSLGVVLDEIEAAEASPDVERSVEHRVIVVSSVTEEQFATLLRMCGLPPERLKKWVNDREPTESGRFRVDVPDDVFADLVAFALQAGLQFRTETTVASTYRPRTAPR